MTEEREAIHRRAIERERENRWNAKGRACVTHPKYGSVVVPHSSNLAALMNAAEYWDCDWSEITGASVMVAKPGDGPAVKRTYGTRRYGPCRTARRWLCQKNFAGGTEYESEN